MPRQADGANFFSRFNNTGQNPVNDEASVSIKSKVYQKDLLKEMYRKMLLVRYFEERAEKYVYEGKTYGALHLSIGQEATSVGSGAALRQDDYIVGTHRSHGHPIAKGAELDRLMAEVLGKQTGLCKGHGGTMHLADFSVGCLGETSIVGSGIPVAAGAGLAIQNQGLDRICLCYFGDGAACEGAFHEGMNYSAIWKLPVVFFCENNNVAITTTADYSIAGGSIAARAAGYGIPGVTVDGQDILAVYDAVVEAAARARKGEGPTLIEAKTYKFREHAIGLTAGFEYRSKEELEYNIKNRDPIKLFEAVLKEHNVISGEPEFEGISESAKNEVNAARKFAEDSPDAYAEEVFDSLYRKPIKIDTKF